MGYCMKNPINPARRVTRDQLARVSRKFLSRMSFALTRTDPPPCAACHLFRKCGKESLACLDFWNYVRGIKGAAPLPRRNPTRHIFNQVNAYDGFDDETGDEDATEEMAQTEEAPEFCDEEPR